MDPTFVHLHLHSEYSLVDGLVRIKPLVKTVAAAGMPAVAVTDQGNLFSLVRFYKAAVGAGVKPIAGADLWVRNPEDANHPHRLVLLAQDEPGYRNLTRLISRGFVEGQHLGVAQVERDWILEAHQGLIALSGGPRGDVAEALLKGRDAIAEQRLDAWLSVFEDRYYLELMRTGRALEGELIESSVDLAIRRGVPVVATNDVRFLAAGDFEAHEARVCIHQGRTLDDPRRPRDYSEEQYLRTPAEMAELFADLPEALENTVEIAKRCNLELKLGKNYLPVFPVPEGMTTDSFFAEQSRRGLEWRLERILDRDAPDYAERRRVYEERLETELAVIIQMGFPGYFLIVADFIQWAKDNGIPVGPGRGSGAGSLVAYALKITDLDPIEHELLFERFLNPERVSMPDFDIDFCMEGRDRVIDYVARKYGREAVSQIITFGTMAAKAVVRDVGRVMGHPYGFVDKIAKMVPFELGMTLEKALKESEDLKRAYDQDEEVRAILDMARKLEGLTRNAGKHAGGVVIAPTVLTDFAPLYCEPGGANLVTQYDKDDVEQVGLVKFDFLGLRTLTIIDWALKTINAGRAAKGEPPLDIERIDPRDQEAFDLLKRCETTAVFQLESRGMKELIKKLQPDCFDEITALVALFRPGPLQSGMVDDFIERKHGRAEVAYPHPDLEPILKPTYGIILYQEQVMQIAQVLAGYSLGGADILRRCLAGSTEVVDAATGRRVTLSEIAAAPEVWIGREVFALDLKTQKIVHQPIDAVYHNGVQEVFEVTTRTGRRIQATATHLFYTLMGWKPLGAFQPGDRIGLAGTLPIEHGCGITDAQIKLTAYLLGDGHLSTRKPANCYFCNSDPALIADFNRCVAELFGRSAPVDYQLHPGRQSVGYVRVGCLSEFNAWIDSHIQRAHSHDKVIPDWVDALSRDQLRLFIGTLWSTDGTFDTSIGHADYTSTSRRMIEQLQHLLLRLGIVALFNIKTIQYQGQPHRSYRAQITGREEMLKFYDRIQPFLSRRKQDKAEICYRMIRDKARNQSKHTIPAEVIGLIANAKYASGMTWAEIDQAVGMRPGTMSSGLNFKIPPRRALARHRVLNFATAFKSDELRAIADSEVFWDVIESIRPLGQMEVFDLTIPKHHNFIANDFIAHNCMGKKKPEEMAKQRDTFEQGALARGIDGQLSSHVFNLIEYFSGYGFNKCIVGETLVADPATGERRKVKEIYRNGIASVASLMPDHRMGRSSVVQVMENGIKPVFRLRTSLGKTLRATGNHPLLTASGWKRLDELKEGDRIASPSRLPIEGQERWSEHELITLGWVLSEGNTCHPSGFYFYNKDEVARDDFLAAASAFPDTQPTVRLRPERADTWCVYVGTGRDTRIRVGGGYSFTPRSGARLWLEDLGMIGHKAPDKHFPASVFRLDNACLAVLLGRLWSGDGYIASTSGKDMIPYLASASQRLAGETQHLLLRLGIVSRLTEKRFAYKDGRIGYTLHLVGRRSIEAFVQVIGPHLVGRDVQLNALRDYLAQTPADRESVDTLPPEVKDSVRCHKEASGLTWDQIAERSGVCVKEFYGTPKTHKKGFRRATIRKLADFFGADDLRQAANAEIFWERIVAIEPDGAAMTYDLEVDHTHNFVADDIIVHNSHSAAYALVSYQTLWLKAHYPAAFMAAVLSADMDNTDKVVTLIDECRTMKLRVDPPAINRSDYHFTIADDKTVVYGLGAVKGVGESAIEAMLEARRAGGSFRDLWDFCGRIDLQRVNRRVLESLIRAGALDELGPNRATLMAHLPLALKAAEQYHSTRAAGQVDLFGALEPSGPPTPDPQLARETLADWEDEQRLQGEKETLGLYLTGHPIDRYEDELKAMGGARIARLLETDRELGRRDRRDREKRTVVGLVVGVRHGKTQRGRMGSVVLDDRTGRIEATVFSELYEQARHLLVADQILSITGALNFDEFRDAWSLRADSVRTFEDARATAADHLLLTLDLSDPAVHARGPERVEELRAVLLAHRDTARETSVPIRLIYRRPGAVGELMLGSAWRVRPADALLKQLRQLLGAESVRVSYERPVQQAAMSELQSPPRLRVVS